ncbi:complex I subunit 5 family protein [Nesterenkonia sandarakina]|uniref:Formate hydrogenlyase subunit 3/multisubunit Na+/H+ antiporter MnhD subunit n=1 Tax=Nesterenkonia sandarakina TaxID=272918 RepID=A0A7Z0J2M7_9MICC|nr:proton-conducting transporter membrane subunit [Nesterenkonia sandarakina]NYJ16445.1 formate hydrogenlyase subunit 3/multisubunit Na+/H+ antiporter MnhD subunit [Nesterenkonia sandarakina]
MTAPLNLAPFCLAAVVLIPLLASALSVLLGSRARRVLGVVTSVAVLGLSAPILVHVSSGRMLQLALGGFDPPLGITLRADGLSAVFLAMTTVIGTVLSCYAAARPAATGTHRAALPGVTDPDGTAAAPGPASAATDRGWRPGHAGFWPLWLGCWAGLNAVFLSGDLFNTYVGLELVGLTAVALVALGGREAWPAALRYLFIAVLGSLLFLIGVALIYSVTGTLDIIASGQSIAELAAEDDADLAAVVLAMCLISLGLALKIALVPLHRWLIPAHSAAPSAVSPLLSALVIKAALFVLLRSWLWVAGPLPELTALAWVLAGMGTAAVLLGSVMALRQSRLKPLIAYSTVAQVGYWFLLLPLLLDPSSSALEAQTTLDDGAVLAGALSGTVALALGHGVAKSSLFLCAGHLKDRYGTDEIAQLRGAGRAHPMLVMSMGLSAVGLIGLPLSLGFSGKWLLATSAVAAGDYWILLVLVAGTLFSAAYLLKAVAPLLVMSEDDQTALALPQARTAQHVAEASTTGKAQLAPFVLGLLTVLTGFLGVWLSDILEVGAPW